MHVDVFYLNTLLMNGNFDVPNLFRAVLAIPLTKSMILVIVFARTSAFLDYAGVDSVCGY